MSKTKLFILPILCLICACTKFDSPNQEAAGSNVPSFDFDVPKDFDWSIHTTLDIEIAVANQYDGRFNYFVEIYDGDKLLDKGFIYGGIDKYSTKLSVLKALNTLSVVQVDPNGNKARVDVPIVGNTLKFDFKSLANSATRSNSTMASSKITRSAPDVPEDAITAPSDGKLKKGKTYVIKSGQSSSATLAEDVTLYIAGTYEPDGWIGNEITDVNIYILPSGIMDTESFSAFEINIYNYGTFNATEITFRYKTWGDEDDRNVLENYGDINVSEKGLTVYNTEFTNNHNIFATSFSAYNSEVQNTGIIKIKNSFFFENSDVEVGAGGMLQGNSCTASNGTLTMLDDSKISLTTSFSGGADQIITNPDDAYGVIICQNFDIGNKDNLEGKICVDANTINGGGSNRWDSKFSQGNPGAYIVLVPITEYNDNGYNASDDSEENKDPGDNLIPDNEIIYFQTTRRVVVEDNFPKKGDFDMNDLVCDWQLGMQKNSKNEVVKIGIKYWVKAVGAGKQLAAAMKIKNIPGIRSAKLSKNHNFADYFIVSNGLEDDNTDIVVPLFEDAHALFDLSSKVFINVGTVANIDPYEFFVEIELDPVDAQFVIQDNFDLFIVTEGNTKKRTEIHPFDGKTTSKASNNTDFSMNSASIWSVVLTPAFAYPKESVSIQRAYLKFQTWVQSAGNEEKEWYTEPQPGLVTEQATEE